MTINAVRSRVARGTAAIAAGTQHRDVLLPSLARARHLIERVTQAVRTTGPRQRELTHSELEAIRTMAEEIRNAAGELVNALTSSVTLVG